MKYGTNILYEMWHQQIKQILFKMLIYIHVKPDNDNDNDNDPLKMKCALLINTAFLNEYYYVTLYLLIYRYFMT